MTPDRKTFFEYIKKEYKVTPDYPWKKYPDNAVFRHSDNNKWFALVMYVAAPVSAILYKCKVLETDIPYEYQDRNLVLKALMKIRLLKRYDPEAFTFDVLKEDYGIYAVRGPRGVPYSLSQELR